MKSQIEQKYSIFFGNTGYDKLRELITINKYDFLIFSERKQKNFILYHVLAQGGGTYYGK